MIALNSQADLLTDQESMGWHQPCTFLKATQPRILNGEVSSLKTEVEEISFTTLHPAPGTMSGT